MQGRRVQGYEPRVSPKRLAVRWLSARKQLRQWRPVVVPGRILLHGAVGRSAAVSARCLLPRGCVGSDPVPGRHLQRPRGRDHPGGGLSAVREWVLLHHAGLHPVRRLPGPQQHHGPKRPVGGAVRVRRWVRDGGRGVREVRLCVLLCPGRLGFLYVVSRPQQHHRAGFDCCFPMHLRYWVQDQRPRRMRRLSR